MFTLNDKNKLYPRGFIFSDEKMERLPNFYKQVKILDKYYYSYDQDVNYNVLTYNNDFIIIHGIYVHVAHDFQYTSEGLLKYLLESFKRDYDKFLETLDFIAGRYSIIIGDQTNVYVYPDAAHTRTTYFSTNRDVISSHVYLIRDQFNNEREKYIKELPNLTNGLLRTPFKEIKSIIPNHMLNIRTKKLSRFYPRKENRYKNTPEERKFQMIDRILEEQLKFMFNNYDNVVTSLTGGGDSRFILAILKNYLSKTEFFTYATKSVPDNSSYEARILTLDLVIVQQLLENINLNHKFMFYKEDKLEIEENVKNLITKNTIGPHSQFLVQQILKHFPVDNLLHIRGNLLEIGQSRLYRNEYRESTVEEVKIEFLKKYSTSKNEDAKEFTEKSFDDFIDEINFGNNTYDFHLLDLYYWEIRGGRWYSELINTHDIVFETLSPFSHRALIEISLSFPYEKRKEEYMYTEMINKKFPILNFFGDNNPLNYYEQNRNEKYK